MEVAFLLHRPDTVNNDPLDDESSPQQRTGQNVSMEWDTRNYGRGDSATSLLGISADNDIISSLFQIKRHVVRSVLLVEPIKPTRNDIQSMTAPLDDTLDHWP